MVEFESNGPLVTATIWPVMFIAGVFLGLRLFVKFHGGSRLWWDDYLLVFSWVSLFGPRSFFFFAPTGWVMLALCD